jgi:hypothetical protein
MGIHYGKMIATGGEVTRYISSGYVYFVHTFNNSHNLVLHQNIDVDYLVVGGGGPAMQVNSGGGGGGGVLSGSFTNLNKGVYQIAVGNGGQPSSVSIYNIGTNGGDSSFNGVTAKGGGCGTYYTVQAASGGCGGGGAHSCCGLVRAAGTAGQGYNGGFGNWTYGYGGGGGAGSAGADGTNLVSGNGGSGIASDITGSSVYYGGGGAGGVNTYGNVVASGTGGIGGGGNPGQAGTDGLGGGAGGFSSGSGRGGRGVVIVRYRILLPTY